jgi:hypothetical protein
MNYSILALGLAALLVGCEGDGSRPYVANSSDPYLSQGSQYGTTPGRPEAGGMVRAPCKRPEAMLRAPLSESSKADQEALTASS